MKLFEVIQPLQDIKIIYCLYTNWKGETENRRIKPVEVRYGTCSPWHSEPQWLMYAYDIDKEDYREFAMNKMEYVKELE